MKVTNLTVESITFDARREVIKDFNAKFNPGMNVIYGPPASGKSTLLQALAGINKPKKGRVYCDIKLSFVSQVPEREFIHSDCASELGGNGEEVIKDIIKIGLDPSILGASPWNLSRGEKKRLAILRALREHGYERKALIIDDPFCDLDRKGREKIAEILKSFGDYVVIISTNRDEDLSLLQKKEIKYKLFSI